MHDLSKLAAQVRGARALLGWSQSYLADGISVRRLIIADFESCKREPQEASSSGVGRLVGLRCVLCNSPYGQR